MNSTDTIHQLIQDCARSQADPTALLAPEMSSITFRNLARQLESIGSGLRALEIEKTDRVAVVLPNGPAMAAVFLGVAAFAACAPLNPNFRKQDFEFYLQDLEAKAIVVAMGVESPARAVAEQLGMSILEVSQLPDSESGLFQIQDFEADPTVKAIPSEPKDIAMVLHTSGTTSRPKLVPLSHQNLCCSASNVANTLGLTGQDRCLNVMPLFHIHGLVAGLLASMKSGASVVCSPGYDAENFPNWMNDFQPTWYTAVPTIHQAVLAQSRRNGPPSSKSLRLIRSSSSSLPPSVMEELESTFSVPVIEAYGMTEAAHQMACNPLPPGARKAGTVGPSAGPKMAIMDDSGKLLEPGQIGEIVISGPNVTAGYLENPEANATAFEKGWFRTGDLGEMDEDGYFTITGRSKEMINRGGENISPREIDEALLEHPAIAQAVAFAVPHPTLGEDLAAAVVLQSDTQIDEQTLRDVVCARVFLVGLDRASRPADENASVVAGKKTLKALYSGFLKESAASALLSGRDSGFEALEECS